MYLLYESTSFSTFRNLLYESTSLSTSVYLLYESTLLWISRNLLYESTSLSTSLYLLYESTSLTMTLSFGDWSDCCLFFWTNRKNSKAFNRVGTACRHETDKRHQHHLMQRSKISWRKIPSKIVEWSWLREIYISFRSGADNQWTIPFQHKTCWIQMRYAYVQLCVTYERVVEMWVVKNVTTVQKFELISDKERV